MDSTTHSLEEFQAMAIKHARALTPQTGHARIILLRGELGAGKTTYAQAFAKALGVTETVTSPTFIIYKVYDLLQESSFSRLIHVDAYRLESKEELTIHGFDALLDDSDSVILFEWPEKVEGLFTMPHTLLSIESTGEHERTLTYEEIS